MKFLHTSDWHIGRTLYGRKRYDEFTRFLDWLAEQIDQHQVDCLLVSGDVFDTTTPSNRSQSLYYKFLFAVSASACRHVVIIGGNHDSPSFLNAPKALLKAIDIHVVGAACEAPEEEVVCLRNRSGEIEAVVCAVPYLRDRDIRTVGVDESIEDKTDRLVKGIKEHYKAVCAAAVKKGGRTVPVIGMGHLFAAGGKTAEGDGVRQLHVGSLSRVGADVFPDSLDYVALGHLHIAQTVDRNQTIRYAGSPIPMGFGEAGQEKQVMLVLFDGRTPEITPLAVPRFQELERVSGNIHEILERIEALKAGRSRAWLEIDYTGKALVPDLGQQVEAAVEQSDMEIRRIRNRHLVRRILQKDRAAPTLEELDVHEVFDRLLEANAIDGAEQERLRQTYRETLKMIYEADSRAE